MLDGSFGCNRLRWSFGRIDVRTRVSWQAREHSFSQKSESVLPNMLQIGQVIFYLLLRQLSETWTFGPFHALIAQEMIGGRTHDSYSETSAPNLRLRGP